VPAGTPAQQSNEEEPSSATSSVSEDDLDSELGAERASGTQDLATEEPSAIEDPRLAEEATPQEGQASEREHVPELQRESVEDGESPSEEIGREEPHVDDWTEPVVQLQEAELARTAESAVVRENPEEPSPETVVPFKDLNEGEADAPGPTPPAALERRVEPTAEPPGAPGEPPAEPGAVVEGSGEAAETPRRKFRLFRRGGEE
jgi:hypothetical protein